jgi:hypothetical protein
MEPRLKLKPNVWRFVVPRALLLVGLCGLFNALLMINLYLLFGEVELAYLVYSVVILVLLSTLGIIVEWVRANNWSYLFFNDRVEFHKKHNVKHKDTLYNEVVKVGIERNLFDRWFNTATYVLKPRLKIRFINYTNNMYFYVQKLVQRSRKLKDIKKDV